MTMMDDGDFMEDDVIYTVHTIVTCRLCGARYDMDMDEALDDEHRDPITENEWCTSDQWNVDSVSHPADELCYWDD